MIKILATQGKKRKIAAIDSDSTQEKQVPQSSYPEVQIDNAIKPQHRTVEDSATDARSEDMIELIAKHQYQKVPFVPKITSSKNANCRNEGGSQNNKVTARGGVTNMSESPIAREEKDSTEAGHNADFGDNIQPQLMEGILNLSPLNCRKCSGIIQIITHQSSITPHNSPTQEDKPKKLWTPHPIPKEKEDLAQSSNE